MERKAVRRRRASKPKVKTGCHTCKIRRVKCDETKLGCNQCKRTGRICDDYYEFEKQKAQPYKRSPANVSAKAPTLLRQLQVFDGSTKEMRAIEFFVHQTAPQLSGLFSSSFWNRYVIQFGLIEPAIRHGMVALSTIYENDSFPGISLCAGTEDHQNFALVSYNKAIRSLIKTTQRDSNGIRIPVIAAIIFVCVDFLRGNVCGAIAHIESGIKMIKDWRKNQGQFTASGFPKGVTAEREFVEEELVPMFGSLNMLASLFGRPSLQTYSDGTAPGELYAPGQEVKTIRQACHQLYDLISKILRFIQSIGDLKYKANVGVEVTKQQMRLKGDLDGWGANFHVLVQNNDATEAGRNWRGINLLRAWSLTMSVWLATCLSPNETAWDQHKSCYDEIVRLCESLTSKSSSCPGIGGPFSFEIGIVPPLRFVAWKCRWPHTRRTALSLLLSFPRRESVFDSHRSYQMFTRVMLIEEKSFGLLAAVLPKEHQLPPEMSRIHQVVVSPSSSTPAGDSINFMMKPWGLDRP